MEQSIHGLKKLLATVFLIHNSETERIHMRQSTRLLKKTKPVLPAKIKKWSQKWMSCRMSNATSVIARYLLYACNCFESRNQFTTLLMSLYIFKVHQYDFWSGYRLPVIWAGIFYRIILFFSFPNISIYIRQ